MSIGSQRYLFVYKRWFGSLVKTLTIEPGPHSSQRRLSKVLGNSPYIVLINGAVQFSFEIFSGHSRVVIFIVRSPGLRSFVGVPVLDSCFLLFCLPVFWELHIVIGWLIPVKVLEVPIHFRFRRVPDFIQMSSGAPFRVLVLSLNLDVVSVSPYTSFLRPSGQSI